MAKKKKKKNLNPKTDRCGVPDPMNCNTKKKCQFGLAITQTKKYQKSVGKKKARCEFNRVKNILEKQYDVKVKKPFKVK